MGRVASTVSLAVLLCAWGPALAPAWGRTWSDSTGKFQVEADFVRLEGGQVYLRKSNGKMLKPIALDRLSEADRQFVRDLTSSPGDDLPPGAPSETAPSEAPAGPQALAWQFTAGQQLPCQVHIKLMVEIKTPSAPVKIQADVTQTARWTIKEVGSDGAATIGYRIERMAGEMRPPLGQPIKFDTANEKAGDRPNPVAAAMIAPLKQLLNGEILLKVTAAGKVLEVTVPDSMKQANWGAAGQGPMAATGGMADPNQIAEQLGDLLGFLPPGPVAPGSSWFQPIERPMPPSGVLKGKSTFTFQGLEERNGRLLAKIVEEDQLVFEATAPPAGTPPAPPSPANPQVTVTPKKQGTTFWFDPEAGTLVESNAVSVQQVVAVSGPAPHQTQDTTIETQVDVTLAEAASDAATTGAPPAAGQ